jgi:hypothetical protein
MLQVGLNGLPFNMVYSYVSSFFNGSSLHINQGIHPGIYNTPQHTLTQHVISYVDTLETVYANVKSFNSRNIDWHILIVKENASNDL